MYYSALFSARCLICIPSMHGRWARMTEIFDTVNQRCGTFCLSRTILIVFTSFSASCKMITFKSTRFFSGHFNSSSLEQWRKLLLLDEDYIVWCWWWWYSTAFPGLHWSVWNAVDSLQGSVLKRIAYISKSFQTHIHISVWLVKVGKIIRAYEPPIKLKAY